MFKNFFDATTCIPKTPTIDIEIILLPDLCQKLKTFSCLTNFEWWPSWISLKCLLMQQQTPKYIPIESYMHFFFCTGLMADILENDSFSAQATLFEIPSSRFFKLGVFHTLINCQSLCPLKCIWVYISDVTMTQYARWSVKW